jgi:hypothetical protein
VPSLPTCRAVDNGPSPLSRIARDRDTRPRRRDDGGRPARAPHPVSDRRGARSSRRSLSRKLEEDGSRPLVDTDDSGWWCRSGERGAVSRPLSRRRERSASGCRSGIRGTRCPARGTALP